MGRGAMSPIRIRIGLCGLVCITSSKTVLRYSLGIRDLSFTETLSTTSLFLGSWRVGIGRLRLDWQYIGAELFWRGGNMLVRRLGLLHGFKKCTPLVRTGKHVVYLLR